jgi:hypothetical protein
MGIIKIETAGSFGNQSKTFSAMKNGHAHAVSEAIKFLTFVLHDAIDNDHNCHQGGIYPENGFSIKTRAEGTRKSGDRGGSR